MAGWLVKSDPGTYALADLERDRKTVWDGVANAVAVRHLRAVQRGDDVLVYHTGDEKAIVGLARAASAGRPDPRNAKLAVMDLAFVRRFAFPVPLGAIKADARFADWDLVRQPRLSVMPVPKALWSRLLAMAGERG
jgi:predicted RNA-binding protein with PUA-like domain